MDRFFAPPDLARPADLQSPKAALRVVRAGEDLSEDRSRVTGDKPSPAGRGWPRSGRVRADKESSRLSMLRNPPLLSKVRQNARGLRRAMTIPERLLWGKLRGGRLAELKFRRQHPIGAYVADFYCHEHHLVVELDGNSHIGTAEYDLQREQYLLNAGLRVIRFSNDDVIEDLDAVLNAILVNCGIDPGDYS